MRIVVTNDDGIHAPGLQALARHLVAGGHEVFVAAPLREHSGSGTSLDSPLDGRLIAAEAIELPELPGVPALAVDAPPAMVGLALAHGLLDLEADLLVSGINAGHNVGRLTLHSGTVAAAQTVAAHAWPALAVSCSGRDDRGFQNTAAFAARALKALVPLANHGGVLNVNFPGCPLDHVRGVRVASLALPPAGDVRLSREPAGFRLQLSRDPRTVAHDSDLALVQDDWITLTRLAATPRALSLPDTLLGPLRRLLAD